MTWMLCLTAIWRRATVAALYRTETGAARGALGQLDFNSYVSVGLRLLNCAQRDIYLVLHAFAERRVQKESIDRRDSLIVRLIRLSRRPQLSCPIVRAPVLRRPHPHSNPARQPRRTLPDPRREATGAVLLLLVKWRTRL